MGCNKFETDFMQSKAESRHRLPLLTTLGQRVSIAMSAVANIGAQPGRNSLHMPAVKNDCGINMKIRNTKRWQRDARGTEGKHKRKYDAANLAVVENKQAARTN